MATRRKKEREMCIEAENIYEVYLWKIGEWEWRMGEQIAVETVDGKPLHR
jgi:hypothetical protein